LNETVARGTSLVIVGRPSPAAAELLGLIPIDDVYVTRVRLDHPDLRRRADPCLPGPDQQGAVTLDPTRVGFDVPENRGWQVLARWLPDSKTAAPGPAAVAVRTQPAARGDPLSVAVWFGVSAEALDWRATEAVIAAAEFALELAAPKGLIGLWRWPHGRSSAVVVDGDVDHPTGVDPECSRYVAPALETARRAGFPAYGIFAAAANVEAEPSSFPSAAGYYNHSYTHPYSHWNPQPWESLDDEVMEREIVQSNQTFVRLLGKGDEGIFRLPHFQLAASDRTYRVLDRLGYRADSSIGANASITGGLPFHPAHAPWSRRAADAAYVRSHPDPSKRHHILQLPISTDPSDPAFPHGLCSYNTLDQGVRSRTADPGAYETLLDDVLQRAVTRRNLAHVFIDPPDAGYGRFPDDRVDYASAIERWLRHATEHADVAILTTAELATWWLEREDALSRLTWRVTEGSLLVELPDPMAGATLAVLLPRREATEVGSWHILPFDGHE
jgi:hypothetical protein